MRQYAWNSIVVNAFERNVLCGRITDRMRLQPLPRSTCNRNDVSALHDLLLYPAYSLRSTRWRRIIFFYSRTQRVQRLQIFQIRGVAGGFLSRANKSPHPSSVLISPSERVRNAFPAENKVFGKSSRRRERYERRCNSFPVVTSRHAEAGP